MSDLQKYLKMKDEACMYNKYGFCKFKDYCKRNHDKEICKDSNKCKGAKVCQKRHPKPCKRYNSDKGCHFGSECAYHHTESAKAKLSTKEIEKKVEVLETIVLEMAKKVEQLQAELNYIKKVQKPSETTRDTHHSRTSI